MALNPNPQALTPDSVDNQSDSVYQATSNRATVINTTPAKQEDTLDDDELATEVDSEEEEVVTEDGDELPELGDLPEDPETDETDEFVEGSPRFEQFKSDFQKAFGLPMDEARDLVQSLKEDAVKRELNEQKYELSSVWDVPVFIVDQRLAIVAKMWSKLPADKQQAYDSTKGAQVLWARYEQQQSKKSSTKGAQTTTKGGMKTTNKSGYMFTQRQIDSMDAATYSQNADAIMVAYAQGKVKK